MRKLLTIIILILAFSIIIFLKLQKNEIKYVKSHIDGNEYLVRDLEDKQEAADMLAKLKKNIMIIVNYLYENKNNYNEYKKYIEQLHSRIQNVIINESSVNSAYTSYSVNKGEQIIFCLRSKYYKNKIHDLNLLMYVALHEMSHTACTEFGHTKLFKQIFAFITKIAIRIGLYKPIDFEKNPMEYCGLTISESII